MSFSIKSMKQSCEKAVQTFIRLPIDPLIFHQFRQRLLHTAFSADIHSDHPLMFKYLQKESLQYRQRHVPLVPVCSRLAAVKDIFVYRNIDRKIHSDKTELSVNLPVLDFLSADADQLLSQITGTKTVTLTAAGWGGSAAPFTQSAAVSGVTSSDTPVIGLALGTGDSGSSKNIERSFSFIYTAVTGDGTITFYARKKPTVNIPLMVKGK